MKNSSTNDDRRDSSNPSPNPNPNPNPPNSELTPARRRSGRGRARCRTSSAPQRDFSPPQWTSLSGGCESWLAGGGDARPLPAGGSGFTPAEGSSTGPGPAARKRVREVAAEDAPAAGGGNQQEVGGFSPLNCSTCGKKFTTPNALYRHMRAHAGRGPPPVLTAEGDSSRGLNQPEAAGGGKVDQEGDDGGGAGLMEVEEAGEGGREASEPPNRLPDLNYPPPPDDN